MLLFGAIAQCESTSRLSPPPQDHHLILRFVHHRLPPKQNDSQETCLILKMLLRVIPSIAVTAVRPTSVELAYKITVKPSKWIVALGPTYAPFVKDLHS